MIAFILSQIRNPETLITLFLGLVILFLMYVLIHAWRDNSEVYQPSEYIFTQRVNADDRLTVQKK